MIKPGRETCPAFLISCKAPFNATGISYKVGKDLKNDKITFHSSLLGRMRFAVHCLVVWLLATERANPYLCRNQDGIKYICILGKLPTSILNTFNTYPICLYHLFGHTASQIDTKRCSNFVCAVPLQVVYGDLLFILCTGLTKISFLRFRTIYNHLSNYSDMH